MALEGSSTSSEASVPTALAVPLLPTTAQELDVAEAASLLRRHSGAGATTPTLAGLDREAHASAANQHPVHVMAPTAPDVSDTKLALLLAKAEETKQQADQAAADLARLEQLLPPLTIRSTEQKLALAEAKTGAAEAARAAAEAQAQAEKAMAVNNLEAEKAARAAAEAQAQAEKDMAVNNLEAEKAARAAAEAARAAAEAARAAAEARTQRLEDELGRLNLSSPKSPIGSRGGQRRDLQAQGTIGFVSKYHTKDTLLTPSRASASNSILAPSRSSLLAQPVSVKPMDSSMAVAFGSVLAVAEKADESGSLVARALMSEANYYELAASILPPFVERLSSGYGEMNATALFSKTATMTPRWTLAGECLPELHVRGNTTKGAHGFVPGYNGELKTAGNYRGLEQAVFYAVMDMTRIFFPATVLDQGGVAPCATRFFNKPLLAYALVAFPHVGYFVVIEMIGKLLVSPISLPFFLGSEEHRKAANALPLVEYDEPFEPGSSWEKLVWSQYPANDTNPLVVWTIHDNIFLKVVMESAQTGEAFVSMHRAYTHLAGELANSSADRPPSLPAWVQLMYGAHAVLVKMPAVHGSPCDDDEVFQAGNDLDLVADAVVWLARHRLVYVDLRGPNVMRPRDAQPSPVCLVDFDDCVLAADPVTTLVDYQNHLKEYCDRVRAASDVAVASFFAAWFLAESDTAVHIALAKAFAKAGPCAPIST